MFNGRTYFQAALYQTTGCFSHLPRFIGQFESHLTPLPFDRDCTLDAVRKIKQDYLRIDRKIDNKKALELLMAADLEKVENILVSDEWKKRIDSEFAIEESLLECRDQGVILLERLGLTVSAPEIFIVDKMPSPYDRTDVSAIAADEDDYRQHGILPGLYFLRARLRPFYSRFLLLHEIIHTVLGTRSPLIFGRGLEEGLAEIIGSLFLSSKVLGKQLTTDLFIYNRLSYGYNQFWELYLDYTRQAAYLYLQHGMDGLVAILNGGRESIKEIENKCLRNNLKNIELPKGAWDEDVSDLVNYLLFAFGRNL